MFPSTITITVAPSTDRILNRVNQDNYGSEYHFANATESVVLKIRHSVDSRDGDGMTMKRHNVFIERVVFPTATDSMKKFTSTTTFRHGEWNDPQAAASLTDGLVDWLGSGTVTADLAVGSN